MAIKTLNGLKKKIEACVNKALREEVTDAIRKEEQDKIKQEVYSAYNPPNPVYERRYHSGGLIADENIVGTVRGGKLTVVNNTPPNPNARDGATTNKDLVSVIETGVGYDYTPHPGARPFIQPTIDSLRASNKVEESLKQGLKKQGLNVK